MPVKRSFNLNQKQILLLGFGDLALRITERLPGQRICGVARSPKAAVGVDMWQGAADSSAVLEHMGLFDWDSVVITLTPMEMSDRAYKFSYVDTLAEVLQALTKRPPGRLYFASSTSVYGQNDGAWVDEHSETKPTGFAGKRMLEAEALLRQAPFATTALRFAGIYGPGRDYLIRQVMQGYGGTKQFTNRIHAEDCAGFICHLMQREWHGETVEPCYLVADSEPATSRQVREWLAGQLGVDQDHLIEGGGGRGGHKRCSNQGMLASGYRLQYPSYREGYSAMISP